MKRLFGFRQDGQRIAAITLEAGDIAATILTHGAILNEVRLRGVPYSVTVGSPDLAAYDHAPMAQFGALVGPVANRISGAEATLDGVPLSFAANEGANLLHGGEDGLHRAVWQIAAFSQTSLTLTCALPDGKDGFPGNRFITARYSVEAPAQLRLEITASTDRPTLMNLANHSYWNLDGTETTDGHWLRIAADRYLPITDAYLPTRPQPVSGTHFDFREGREISPSDAQRLDHCFCLSDRTVARRPVATLKGRSGLMMTMETTAPGLQVFDGAPMGSGAFDGHRGVPEVGFCGVALEAQHWPDAPNRPEFPSVRLGPDETYRQDTLWRFSRR